MPGPLLAGFTCWPHGGGRKHKAPVGASLTRGSQDVIKKLGPGPPRSDLKPLPVSYTKLPFMAKVYYCPPESSSGN